MAMGCAVVPGVYGKYVQLRVRPSSRSGVFVQEGGSRLSSEDAPPRHLDCEKIQELARWDGTELSKVTRTSSLSAAQQVS
jgi:hypothetical protein